MVGRTQKVDTSQSSRRRFARVCVELDLKIKSYLQSEPSAGSTRWSTRVFILSVLDAECTDIIWKTVLWRNVQSYNRMS